MPTTTISINVADEKDRKVLKILRGARSWAKLLVNIPGLGERRFYGIPSESQADVYYRTNTKQCSCPDFQFRQDGAGYVCKHVRAVRWYVQIVQQERRRREAREAQLASQRERNVFGEGVRVVGMVGE